MCKLSDVKLHTSHVKTKPFIQLQAANINSKLNT